MRRKRRFSDKSERPLLLRANPSAQPARAHLWSSGDPHGPPGRRGRHPRATGGLPHAHLHDGPPDPHRRHERRERRWLGQRPRRWPAVAPAPPCPPGGRSSTPPTRPAGTAGGRTGGAFVRSTFVPAKVDRRVECQRSPWRPWQRRNEHGTGSSDGDKELSHLEGRQSVALLAANAAPAAAAARCRQPRRSHSHHQRLVRGVLHVQEGIGQYSAVSGRRAMSPTGWRQLWKRQANCSGKKSEPSPRALARGIGHATFRLKVRQFRASRTRMNGRGLVSRYLQLPAIQGAEGAHAL